MTAPTIAVIGSGPSGCYVAQALRREWADSEITIIDRLPVPYGLVRYGVAPDHPGTKAVTRQFERMFERENIQFLGNLEIGSDVALDDLRAAFDIVVVATGLYGDRKLGVPGDSLSHIYGAGQITRFLNDHPDEESFTPSFGTRPVIVGNGNVAIDVLRLLIKGADDFHGSDVSKETLAHLAASPVEHIDIVGRSPAALAKFDTVMIKELGKLANVRFEISGRYEGSEPVDSAGQAKIDALKALVSQEAKSDTRTRTVTFHFGWSPVRVAGVDNAAALVLRDSNAPERQQSIPATSIITAIGFEERADRDLCRSDIAGASADLINGYLDNGLYCTGWFRRGPTGTIPDNRADAKHVAENIVKAVNSDEFAGGKPGLAGITQTIKHQVVNHDAWKQIDRAELENAPANRARRKFRNTIAMLGAAQNRQTGEQSK
jgi:ferredoxin/flavodoxin---NADP+ reductase